MTDSNEAKKLSSAIDGLASVIAEIVAERLKSIEEQAQRRVAEMPDPLMSKQQVAAHLGIGIRTVTDWMQRRLLPYYKIGGVVRFQRSDVEAHLERYRVRGRSG